MTKDEALKQALEALEDFVDVIKYDNEQDDIGRRACCDVLSYNPHSEICKAKQAITAIKEAIREHAMYEVQRLGQEIEQEPVAWMHIMDNTEGIKANGAGIVSITQKRKHPFGKAGIDFSKSYPVTSTPLYTHPPQRTEQEPVECDGDFPEGFDKSLDIPAQALRQANAALCEVTNNRMWDVPALAERMLMFCRNTHPPQRKPLTNEQAYDLFGVHYNMSVIRNVEAAHGIKE